MTRSPPRTRRTVRQLGRRVRARRLSRGIGGLRPPEGPPGGGKAATGTKGPSRTPGDPDPSPTPLRRGPPQTLSPRTSTPGGYGRTPALGQSQRLAPVFLRDEPDRPEARWRDLHARSRIRDVPEGSTTVKVEWCRLLPAVGTAAVTSIVAGSPVDTNDPEGFRVAVSLLHEPGVCLPLPPELHWPLRGPHFADLKPIAPLRWAVATTPGTQGGMRGSSPFCRGIRCHSVLMAVSMLSFAALRAGQSAASTPTSPASTRKIPIRSHGRTST